MNAANLKSVIEKLPVYPDLQGRQVEKAPQSVLAVGADVCGKYLGSHYLILWGPDPTMYGAMEKRTTIYRLCHTNALGL